MKTTIDAGLRNSSNRTLRLNLDLDLIRDLYSQGLSTQEIGNKLGCCQYTVWLRLKRLGCVRSNSESKILAGKQGKLGPKSGATAKVKLAPEGIKDLYVNKQLSAQSIANDLHCSETLILRHLHELNCVRNRDEISKLKSGPNSPYWRGGITIRGGYRIRSCQNHHRADSSGYVREHVLVWEQAHNSNLPDGWVIHHLNGIKMDNRPSNLVALPAQKHRLVIPKLKEKIRELEIENAQFRKALDNAQLIFYISEN